MQTTQIDLTQPVEQWPATARIQKPAPPLTKRNSLLVGVHGLNQSQVRLSIKDFMTHFYVLSGTRHGKSNWLDFIARQWIRRPFGLTIIEHHDDVIPNIRRAAILNGYEHRVVDFDFKRPNYTPTINLLEFEKSPDNEINNQRAIDIAAKTVDLIFHVFDQEDQKDSMPLLTRWLTVALFCLAKGGHTLIDLMRMFSDKDFRKQVAMQADNRITDLEWEQFDSYPAREKKQIEDTLLNRVIKFSLNPQIRRLFGSKKSTFSPYRAMEEGQIVLLPLAGIQDPFARRLVAKSFAELYYDQCQRRDPLTRLRPHLFLADEFDEYLLSDRIGLFLAKATKFKLSVGLLHQSMSALREKPKLLDQIRSNVRTWVVGAVSREDAELIALHFWTGSFKATYVKHITKQTKFRPIEETREVVTNSEGESEAEGSATIKSTAKTTGRADTLGISKATHKSKSKSKSEADTTGENDSISDTSSSGYADITGSQHANVLSYPGDMNFSQGSIDSISSSTGFSMSNVHSSNRSFSDVSGRSSSHSEQSSESEGEGESKAESKATSDINLNTEAEGRSKSYTRGKNKSRSVSKVPYNRMEEYQEETGREFFSVEDIKEMATALHFNVQPRQFWLKTGRDAPIPIVTLDNKPVRLHPELEDYGRQLIDKNCARLAAEIDAEFYKNFEKSSQPQIVISNLDKKSTISNNGANTNGEKNVSDFID
ncbi:hypothetical protein IID10_11330 [candidate division KSB1 bacterium]|nr:hypothetical protein [candidate division KSB1 bacterium]